jgi:hypothetical protein
MSSMKNSQQFVDNTIEAFKRHLKIVEVQENVADVMAGFLHDHLEKREVEWLSAMQEVIGEDDANGGHYLNDTFLEGYVRRGEHIRSRLNKLME